MLDTVNLRAEVVSIGDELTSGQRLDTNSQWLSQRLSELGIRTVRHTTVGDDLAGGIEALQLAVGRADVVIVSGGLGPTLDDLTRQTMADAFDCPLELDMESLQRIEQMFASRNREMPERNRVQAMFPRGARAIPNPHGSAPGIDMTIERGDQRCKIFALPGVPAELKQMWAQTVVPRLEAFQGIGLGPWRFHAVKLFGIGESDVEVRLPDLIDRRRVPTVGITVSHATITLRIAARATSDEQFQRLIEPTLQEINAALGELVFGVGDDELEHAIFRQLSQQGLTMACVEIGASSWIGPWMLAAGGKPRIESLVQSFGSGSPNSLGGRGTPAGFVGGLAFPTLEHAVQWSAERLEPGPGLLKQLAHTAQQRLSADVVLVVSGYPSLSDMEQSDSTFAFDFALAIDGDVFVEQKNMGGHPDVLGPRAAKTGLDWLRRKLALRPH